MQKNGLGCGARGNRGKSAANLEQDDGFCCRVTLERRLEERLSRAGSLSQRTSLRGRAGAASQGRPPVCVHGGCWDSVWDICCRCFGKGIPLFLGVAGLPAGKQWPSKQRRRERGSHEVVQCSLALLRVALCSRVPAHTCCLLFPVI